MRERTAGLSLTDNEPKPSEATCPDKAHPERERPTMSKSILRSLVMTGIAAVTIPTLSEAAVLRINCDPAALPDFTSIGAAFTAGAVAPGDTLVVETCAVAPFTYPETVDLTGLVDVRLIAANAGFVGARIEGVAAAAMPSPVVIDGNGIVGPCILVDGSVDVAVHGFRITRCSAEGIVVRNSVRTLVEGNVIRTTLDAVLDDTGIGTRITGNQVRGTLRLFSSRQCLLADNFAFTDAPPIVVDGGEQCSITNNYALSAGPQAIDVVAGVGHRIERNTAIANMNSIRIGAGASDTDVVGNAIATPILDGGASSELVNNF